MNLLTKSILVILALTFTAVFAEATPALGDRATYNVTLTKGTQNATGKVTFELTSFDKSTDTWVQTSITEFDGQKQTHSDKIATADLLDDATIDTVITNCASRKGTSETVKSPAGDFPSCAVPIASSESTGTVWVSKVPFGYSKWHLVRNDGVTVDSLIESFVNGSGN